MTENANVQLPKQQKKSRFSFKEDVLNIRNVEKRDFGLDVVKVIAMVFVLSVHFFLYNNHYYLYTIGSDDQGTGFIIATIFRDLFFICVPLFLLVSGALSYYHPADLTKRNYVKITPILVNSFLVAGIVVIYKLAMATPGVEDASLTPYRLMQGVWSGTLPGYGWYVNMYVSLFVLMPILDIAYNALDSQKKKTCMVIAMILITFVPLSLNKFKFEKTSIGIMPSYFCAILWPAAYYVIGKYLREFSFKINRLLLSVVLVFCLVYQALGVYINGDGKTFYKSFYADNSDFITMVTAVVFFLMIYNVNTKSIKIRSIFASLSSLTLSVLLLSWFGDQIMHYKLGKIFSPTPQNFGDYFVDFLRVVPLNLVLSILGAYIIGVLVKLISRPIMKFILNHSISELFKSKKSEAQVNNESE